MKTYTKELKITSTDSTSFKQYLYDINKYPLLNEEEEVRYAIKASNGDIHAQRILIECNLRFVVSVAKSQEDSSTKLEDLINEGNMGLIIASQKFDPTKGFKFITYAVWWIRQKINEYKNENSRIVRLPSNKLSQINKVRNSLNNLEQKLGRTPTTIEIVEFMNINSFNDIKICENSVNNILELENTSISSLDKPIDNGGGSIIDIMLSGNETLSDNNLTKIDKEYLIKRLLGTLKPREELIIRLCYGLSEHKPMTLEEIGEMNNVSREAIRQIRDKSLIKLKNSINSSSLDFSDIFNLD